MAIKLKKQSTQEVKSLPSMPIYSKFINLGIVKSMAKSFQNNLLQAGISEDPLLYASRVFFYLLLSSVLTVVLVVFGVLIFVKFYLVFRLSKYLVLSFMMFIFGIIIPPVVYLASTANISQIKENRRIGIEAEMAAFTSIFLIFLRSGLTPRIMFEKISKASAFQYINNVALYINKRMKYLGEGVEDAMLHAASISPSKIMKDYFLTYITAVRTGAPVLETMEAKAKDLAKYLELMASLASDKLSGVAEGYVIWLSSGYIMIFLAMVLEAIFPLGGGGLSSIAMFGALAVIVVPLVNLVFIYVVEQTQLRFPEKKLNYNIFLISFGIGLLVMFILLFLTHEIINFITLSGGINDVVPTVLSVTIGLLIATIPPWIIFRKQLMEGTGYDPYVVSFLRAISEGIRAGLPPEKVIENIKDSKEMGKLGKVLNEIYSYSTLGYPLKDAFRKGAERIRDFTSRISIISLADMMEIGSMTPDTVESIAEQIDTQIRIKRDYDSKIKILLATPYVGVVLALVTSTLLGSAILGLILSQHSSLTYGPLATASVVLPRVIYITAISSLFNSFLAGLLVGKLGSGKIANGLLHSAILVIITAIMLIVLIHIHLNFASSSSSYSFLIMMKLINIIK
ncbi:type II secretion system F family protein [Acidianus sulfidivorans JP7]|uniref:Flagellar assembly protein n=1 Tax=Acidianus sulfidivorans JP7 TaxID=619593 RepID=A0A2U9IKX0_9CREN|nr:type II secretion system F family protein [Acidianus sulfidivorans]AWR96656.1 type II secretion system F family protein [Acidianus sulfidivorans JP7]